VESSVAPRHSDTVRMTYSAETLASSKSEHGARTPRARRAILRTYDSRVGSESGTTATPNRMEK
jgi:hypothetical protein